MIWRTGDPMGIARPPPRRFMITRRGCDRLRSPRRRFSHSLGWTVSLRRETGRGWDGNALSGIAEREYPVAVGGRADQLSPNAEPPRNRRATAPPGPTL